MKIKFLIFILLLILISVASFAQQLSIYGTVKDTSGNLLEGANVILAGTDFGAATDEQGKYEIKNLMRGTYTLEVSMLGYKSEKILNIKLVNQNNLWKSSLRQP